jgi:hypothetical protein
MVYVTFTCFRQGLHMDLTFSLRKKPMRGSTRPDLHALLSAAAARQALTPAARACWAAQRTPGAALATNPRIALFATTGAVRPPFETPSSFAVLSPLSINGRQGS